MMLRNEDGSKGVYARPWQLSIGVEHSPRDMQLGFNV